ncbi:efflux RND transporter periplasmic adaptor subunit [Acidicapsa dinghuensis]|uniref:Efflux RND transporter periplasmic adaptor subunit n=1 Tax=Acidicapsa dinghuensis TaxID=2218256 RepID=A0ABW1EGE0_9BACT|nr:efflux RND transporter periplasmic adaptor subunit [Acidicapsa dinghuensis]
MDISRPDIKKKKRRQQIVWASVAVVLLAATAYAVSRLKPAAPTVDAATIWPGTVKRGTFVRQVRGPGTLVPREDSIMLIPAQTDATVVRIRVLPGARVTPDTILLDLSDPQLDQQLLSAEQALKGAKADYKSMQATLESALMDKKATAAQINASYTQDQLQAQTDQKLFQLGVVSGLVANASKNTAEQLTAQKKISLEQLDVNQKAIEVQLASSQSKVDQAQALYDLYRKQKDELQVRAGISGVLSTLATPVSVGQHVVAGTSVAEVVQPDKLKAALNIAETQAHDIAIGQPAEVDTHNGIVKGHVTRIDPTVLNGTRVVDVSLDGDLPAGAVPNLSVDGTVNLETLSDVLYVERPAFGNENSTISLFKESPDHKTATRVSVKVGKASVNYIQVLQGLQEGDTVVLSDMSREDAVDKIRLE